MANIKDEFKKNVEEPLIKIFGTKDQMANGKLLPSQCTFYFKHHSLISRNLLKMVGYLQFFGGSC